MLALLGGLRGLLSAIGGAGAAFALLTLWHAVLVHPSLEREATAEGQRIERQAWEEAQRMVRAEQERKLALAQSEIDRIEREALEAQSRAALAESALEEVIHEIENSPDPAVIAVPRRLRDQLNAVGR